MSQRLHYTKEKYRKTMEKTGKFKKLVKEKYRIIDNHLQYKHYNKNNLIWLNIIFLLKKEPLLNYVHFKFNHIKRESMEGKIIQLGFYWHGYSNDFIDFIYKCSIYHSIIVWKKLLNKTKIIINYD